MPRPSKYVSPDTFGGFIRAAREHLHLSLAEVASGQYSTSLISQIERNRVDPSKESLEFLAGRLNLDLADLRLLVQQQRETEVEASQYRSFEALRGDAARLLNEGNVLEALALLERIRFADVPSLLRWRLSALRGRCYLKVRRFDEALDDLVYATREEPMPINLSEDQKVDRVVLHLQLARAYLVLRHWEQALVQFDRTLAMVSRSTSFEYVAEAHRGMAQVALMQANEMQHRHNEQESKLLLALNHGEHAHLLYRSIRDSLYTMSCSCIIAEIQIALGRKEPARQTLEELLSTGKGVIRAHDVKKLQELASVVSRASSLLAALEYTDERYEQALEYAKEALTIDDSLPLSSRAEIHVLIGQIHEALGNSKLAQQSYCLAIRELENTDVLGARINAHILYGRYLHNAGQTILGQQEFNQAQRLAGTLQQTFDRTVAFDAVV